VGGIAVPHNADHGSLLQGDQVVGGAVGVSIGGSWSLDPVVAQGCRPIGPVFAIEQAQRNVLLELSDGDRKASPVACLQRVLADLSAEDRELVQHSLFLGVEREELIADAVLAGLNQGSAIADRPERAFLVRNLIGVDPRNGAVAVADRVRAGQNVQFQLREAQASRMEARQLLQHKRDQGGDATPLMGLLFACLGRGNGLFGSPDGDVSIARDVFPQLPVAGSFCNGEIGPLGGATHLHGYTACWGLLRCDAASGANQS
jgi:small ligand-binding sensory domain FIST